MVRRDRTRRERTFTLMAKRKREEPILAAGTIVVRGKGRRREFLVVHRNLRNDWSLPKGKLEKGELMPAAAVRETAEETTVQTVLRQPVAGVRYLSLGQPKFVRYWLAVPSNPAVAAGDVDFDPAWAPNDEVDSIRWLRAERAMKLLTYSQDAKVLESALGLSTLTSPFILLRHAEAEKRAAFAERHDGEPPHDHERPLTDYGAAQTPAIADMLRAYGILRVHSSPARRCMDTVAPNFTAYDELQLEPAISEFGFIDSPKGARSRTLELFVQREPTVVACHRPVLPTMVRAISRATESPEPSAKLKPGEFLVLHRPVGRNGKLTGGRFVSELSSEQTG